MEIAVEESRFEANLVKMLEVELRRGIETYMLVIEIGSR